MLKKVSNFIAHMETIFASVCAGAVTLLILLNIVTRSVGYAIYWVDELAIYVMIWMTLFTTSVMLKKRTSVSVTLLADACPPKVRYWFDAVGDLFVLVFAGIILWLCIRWYDPVGLFQAGMDVLAFQGDTFNFMYSENTNTIGIKKFWIWLALPLFSLSLTIHAVNNFLERIMGKHLVGETTS
ncbi:TRAP transporter small permease subunit [Marinomonas sp. THO17]|uniref:TRAP transporter small permease n=1 Tax=Marinomonas sp. THO17 TaxID=3149048 RepID=UPI00336BD643